jgi:alpha-galactosidase
MKSPKVVVVGAGSMFFGRQALVAMIKSPYLRNGTLAYVDMDQSRLDRMMALASAAIKHAKSPLKLEGSTTHKDVLKGADFVILTFAKNGVYYRGLDCQIALRHGIRMCSGDTIGPGGVFRAMRELPVILEIARDVEKMCPRAWVINYINPSTVNGIGLAKYAPKVKSFALCDGNHMPHTEFGYMKRAGITPTLANLKKWKRVVAGVNHFTWMMECTFKGKDVIPAIRRSMEKDAAQETNEGQSKRKFNLSYSLQLWDIYGLCPTCAAHTKEYVPFWQGMGKATDGLPPLSIFDTIERQRRHDVMWEEVEAYSSGKLPMAEFMAKTKSDHATDIVEEMVSGRGMPFYVNTANNGAVGNLPDDACLELLCDLDLKKGPKPRKHGEFPSGLRSLQMQVLETHEITADAIARSDKNLLVRALLTDPISRVSIPDAREMVKEVLAEEKAALPSSW